MSGGAQVVESVHGAQAHTGDEGSNPSASTILAPAGAVVALDLETTSLDPATGEVVCVALAWDGGEAVLWCSHETAPGRRHPPASIVDLVLSRRWRLVCHNAAFDLPYLAHHGGRGAELWDALLLDTMLGAHHLGTAEALGLKALAVDLLGAEPWAWDWDAGADLRTADPAALAWYAVQDVRHTLALRDYLRRELDPASRRVLAHVTMPALRAIAAFADAPIDLDTVALLDVDLAAAEADAEAELTQLADKLAPGAAKLLERRPGKRPGTTIEPLCERSWSAGARYFRAVMLEAVGAPLNTTPSGKPCWDKEALLRLALGARGDDAAKLAKAVRRHRDAQKARQFFASWQELGAGGHVRPTFSLTRTATGRVACSAPNLQQVPRQGGLRTAFAAPPGYSMAEADFSQIELRVAAAVYGIPELRAAYAAGEDVHLATARRMTGRHDVTKEERSRAKVTGFSLLYGASARGLRRYAFTQFGLDMTEVEARDAWDAYHAAYPGLRRGHARIIREARARGYAETRLGRRRYLPELRSWDGFERGRAERQAVNHPIQGHAAELLLLALPRLVRWAAGVGAQVIATVHDSVLVLVPDGVSPEPIRTIMETPDLSPFPGVKPLGVPLVVDLTLGRSWGDPDAQEVPRPSAA